MRPSASGSNLYPWDFVVITAKSIIKRLSKDAVWLKKAGAMIAVVMDPSSKYWIEDGSTGIENILIAGTALGYGTCRIEGNIRPHMAEFKLLLNIPECLNLLSIITVGIAVEWPTKDKKPLEEVLHCEIF